MSIQAPISSVAMRCVSRMSKFPSYEILRAMTNSAPNFEDTIINITQELLGIHTDWHHLGVDLSNYYQNQTSEIINLLPHTNCLSYDILQLEKDFETIKQIGMDQKSPNEPFGIEGVQQLLKLSRGQIVFFEDFKSLIVQKSDALAKTKDIFGLIAYFEEMYLFLLYSIVDNRSSILTNFIQAKINTYTLLSALKRTQKGQSKEHILRHSIPVPGISAITALKSFAFGDIVGEVGSYLSLESTKITLARIEQELLLREIRAINKAQFSGVGEERIIQYLEQLRHVIANIKLIMINHSKQTLSELSEQRYIPYSNI